MPLLLRPMIAIGFKPLISARLSGTKSSSFISLLAISSFPGVDDSECSKVDEPEVPTTDSTFVTAPKGIGSEDDKGL